MKLNKNAQYAILFTLYLTRAGKAPIENATENMQLSKPLMFQVVRKLRIAGIVKSHRGRYGGYTLIGEPTVKEIIQAVSNTDILGSKEINDYKNGTLEQKALLVFTKKMKVSQNAILNHKITDLTKNAISPAYATFWEGIDNDMSVN